MGLIHNVWINDKFGTVCRRNKPLVTPYKVTFPALNFILFYVQNCSFATAE